MLGFLILLAVILIIMTIYNIRRHLPNIYKKHSDHFMKLSVHFHYTK